MKIKLISVAAVSVFAALSSPTFAQDESYGAQSIGRSYTAPSSHRAHAARGAYNQAPAVAEPEFYNNGWVGEGAFDRSRPGDVDPDLRPSAN